MYRMMAHDVGENRGCHVDTRWYPNLSFSTLVHKDPLALPPGGFFLRSQGVRLLCLPHVTLLNPWILTASAHPRERYRCICNLHQCSISCLESRLQPLWHDTTAAGNTWLRNSPKPATEMCAVLYLRTYACNVLILWSTAMWAVRLDVQRVEHGESCWCEWVRVLMITEAK